MENNLESSRKYLSSVVLPSLFCRVRIRSHHKTNPTPKMANAIFGSPAHHPKKDSETVIERMKNGIQKYTVERKSRDTRDATAANERFGVMAAEARRNGSADLKVCTPQEVQWKPPLRQAATTLSASGGQHNG